MGMRKITEWFWTHKLGDNFALLVNYHVYADMENGNTQPYLVPNGWSIHTLENSRAAFDQYAPFTFKIHINDETREYTFGSGTSVQHYDTDILDLDFDEVIGYYYISFSNSTHIMISVLRPQRGHTSYKVGWMCC